MQDVVKKAARVLVEDHQNVVIGFSVHWIIKRGSMLMLWFHSTVSKKCALQSQRYDNNNWLPAAKTAKVT